MNDELKAKIQAEIDTFRKIDDEGNGYDAAVRALDNIERLIKNDDRC